MARGQRKTIEEKITAKQELIEALMTRVESEKRELEELYQEKKRKELEAVSDIIEEAAGAGGSGRGAAAIPGEQGSGGFLRGVRQAPHWENWIRLPYGKDGYRRRACARERMPSCGGCFRAAAFLRKNDKIVHKKKDSGQKSTLHFRDRKFILCRK